MDGCRCQKYRENYGNAILKGGEVSQRRGILVKMEQKMLQILRKIKTLKELKQTHLQILVNGLGENNYLVPKLIDLSSAFNSLNYATKIFEHAQSPNAVVYNTMIKCLIEKGSEDEAFSTYNEMRPLGVLPNNFTFTFLLKACESLEFLEGCKEIHAQIIKCGFGFTVFVQNALLNVYLQCGADVKVARQVFDEMLERDIVSWNSIIRAYMSRGDMSQAMILFESMPERNVVSWNTVIAGLSKAGDMALAQSVFDRMVIRNTISWNAMISGYLMCGDVTAAKSMFDQMKEKDVVSWTAMISAYSKIGDLDSARKVFDQMPVKNVVSWNAMISGYNQNSKFDEALCTFQAMLIDGKFMPDEATLTSVVSACAHSGSIEHGNWIHSYIEKNKVQTSVALENALIDMFAKCGDIKSAQSVFQRMTRKCIITWTTMISGFAFNGECTEALALHDEMCREGIEPDDVIFIAVLTACTHGGLVQEGRRVFNQMIDQYGIKPRMEHYGCMVDLLGRAAKLEEAIQFIENMPMEPSVVIWATLLSSCITHGAQELIDFVSRKIIDLEPLNSGYQVLVSNSSALGKRWEGVLNARAMIRQEGIEKVPGCSSIQVGREVHEFLVKDTRHVKRKEIYKTLDGLTSLMRQIGYAHLRTPSKQGFSGEVY